MSMHTEFDKGSLLWVKAEIDSTLARASDALSQYTTNKDAAVLKHAKTHLHQAYGALDLVELTGLARFCEEVEQLILVLENGELDEVGLPLALRAIQEIGQYLDRLTAGMPNIPLSLLPTFREVAQLRSANPSGSELYFPQFLLNMPAGLPHKTANAAEMVQVIKQQRMRYESGLLRWLKGQKEVAPVMAASLAELAKHQTSTLPRNFWWSAAALVDGLATNRAEFDLDPQQVLLRLNLQIRRLADGSSKVAERLFRDILYLLPQLDCDSPLARRLAIDFDLSDLFPNAQTVMSAEAMAAEQIARSLRDELSLAKDTWSRVAAGHLEKISTVRQLIQQLAEKSKPLHIDGLGELWDGLSTAVSQGQASQDLALEIATGLLLADNALAIYPSHADDFAQQVTALLRRLLEPSASNELPHLDEISREAQDRLLLSQLAVEMRSNLLSIEEILDAFFRNAQEREALVEIEPMLRQVQGALMMLDRQTAVDLIHECLVRISHHAGAQTNPELHELEELAEALSALGFYVNDLAQERDNEAALLPLLQRLTGREAAVAIVDEFVALEAEPELASVEPLPVAEPESVPESRAMPISEAAIDAELLEVYLEEAVEVLATIESQQVLLHSNPQNREAFTTMRRSFHTLKGSGRMVGLYQLGEVAWSIEQLLNKWLQLDKPASERLLALLDFTHLAFVGWVDQLQKNGHVEVEASAIDAEALALRSEVDVADDEDDVDVSAPAVEVEMAVSNDIQIGDVTVSATLFTIFCEEARKYLSALSHGVEVLAESGEVDANFILAAHTLGGITSTAGFRPQGELAYAVEHALQQQLHIGREQVPLFSEAVNQLHGMMDSIFAEQVPATAPDVIARLGALQAEAVEMILEEEPSSVIEPESTVVIDAVDDEVALVDLVEETLPVQEAEATELMALDLPAIDLNLDELELGLDATDLTYPADALGLMAPSETETETAPFIATEMSEPLLPALDLSRSSEDETVSIAVPNEIDTVNDLVSPIDLIDLVPEQMTELLESDLPLLDLILSDEITLEAEAEITLDDLVIAEETAPTEAVVELESCEAELIAVPEAFVATDLIGHLGLSTAADIDESSPLSQLVSSEDTLNAARAELDATLIDDIDVQLLPIFIEESEELLPQLSHDLRLLSEGSDHDSVLQQIKRTLHTVKGSARMSGAMRMGEAAHRMESRLVEAVEINPELLARLEGDYDLLLALFAELTEPAKPEMAAEVGTGAVPVVPKLLAAAETDNKTVIRVKSELVDQLLNQAGEVAISRTRIEAEMLMFKSSLLDLTENVARLRTQLRELEIQAETQMQAREKEVQEMHASFDPLEFDRFSRLQELTRFMAESVNDVGTVQQSLLKNLDESSAALLAQSRMTKELQQSLMRVRMVPFASVSDRLYRLTRQAGKEVGKKVNLELKGGRVEIDRGVLDKMISPFEHMLRNAIDHGLENTEDRVSQGKSEFGEILIEVRQEGNELVLMLKDDGKGLDLPRIRQKGLDKGLIRADQVVSDNDLCHLIFEPGFSTSSTVTQLSGRGIGMDVVKNEVSNLGGKIDVSTIAGQSTTFVIHLPLTLAVAQVLLVKAGERLIAIPSVMIEQVQELKSDALARIYENREQEWMGQRYRFAYLPRLLGDVAAIPEQKRYSTVILLRSGAERIALHVDQLVKNQEVVVKPIGPQLARIPGVVGATVLGTGEIVLIMNPLALLAQSAQIIAQAQTVDTSHQAQPTMPEQLSTAPVVMVVDDSLTVRKITGRLLAREGFQVVSAKDGVDALQQLHDVKPAVMLVDIEMPRMDGFELTRNVRVADDTKHIPIIMITSRTAEKHKKYAFELGVNAYLGKPYQEDELLGLIRRLVAESAS